MAWTRGGEPANRMISPPTYSKNKLFTEDIIYYIVDKIVCVHCVTDRNLSRDVVDAPCRGCRLLVATNTIFGVLVATNTVAHNTQASYCATQQSLVFRRI